MSEPLHVRYRPETFSEVIGQDAIVKSLRETIKRGDSQAFLFTGPSGVGKTTLSRIAAKACGCSGSNIREYPAAEHTGVDDMRAIISTLIYVPLGGSGGTAVILDECHRLSGQAWDCLLKIVEEPPGHLFWFLCTTEPGKVPKTIKTRCSAYTLAPVSDEELDRMLYSVCSEEKIDIDESVADLCIREAHGSVRQMLVNLAICRDAGTKKEAASLLRSALESDPTIELCQWLLNGGSWGKAMSILEKMEAANTAPEGVRLVVCAYMAKVARVAKSDREIVHALGILEAFRDGAPYNPSEKSAPLINAIGRIKYGQ